MRSTALGKVDSVVEHWPISRREAARPASGMLPEDRERVWRAGFRVGFAWSSPSWANPYIEGTIWHAVWAEGYADGMKKAKE